MVAKTLVGARALLYINQVAVGLFDSASWSVNNSAEPIHTLGRFGPQEICVTSTEAVSVNCSGFRIINQGAYVLPKFPKLQDLLNLEAVKIDIVDRQTGITIMSVEGCVPTSYSTGVQAKSTSRIQITYMGTKVSSEDGVLQNEVGAVELP